MARPLYASTLETTSTVKVGTGLAVGGGTPSTAGIVIPTGTPLSTVTNLYQVATVLQWPAGGLTIAGGLTAGSGVVGIVDATGKIPIISSTYFASLSGANLTGIPTTAISTSTPGGIAYGGATTLSISGAGTLGQLLMSGATGAPTWTTPSFPSASPANGTYLRGNGTNWITSTLILPNAATANRVFYATSTDTMGSTAGLTFDGTTFTASSNTFTSTATSLAGTLTVLGTAGSVFTGAVAADQRLSLTNTTSGATASAIFALAAGTSTGGITTFSQGFGTSGTSIASSTQFSAGGVGGLTLVASDAAGAIKLFWAASSTERATFQAANVAYTNVAGTLIRPQVIFNPTITSTGLSQIPVGVSIDYIMTANPTTGEVRGLGLAAGTTAANAGNSNDIRALVSTAVHNGAGTVSLLSNVLRAQLNSGAGNVVTLLGAKIETEIHGTQSVTTNAGLQVGLTVDASATSGSVFGVLSGYSATDAGAVVSGAVKLFSTNTLVNSGTITGATYGYYVGDITTGTQTGGAYAFYNSDANALNFFEGLTTFNTDVTFAGDIIANASNSLSTPAIQFSSDANTGVYRASADIIGMVAGGVEIMRFDGTVTPTASMASTALGTGSVTGMVFKVGRNASGSGAAGTIDLIGLGGANNYIWADASAAPGVLRISTVPPEEDGNPADTSGTVVGSQTSTRDTKDIIGLSAVTPLAALDAMVDAPVYDFTYKGGSYCGTRFVGLTVDDSPYVGMDPDDAHPHGRSFNPVTAHGYTVLAVKALHEKIAALEAELTRLQDRTH